VWEIRRGGVRVVARIRPLSSPSDKCAVYLGEGEGGVSRSVVCDLSCVGGKGKGNTQSNEQTTKVFHFDGVYGATISNTIFFTLTITPLITSFFRGYNVSVLAYGQTGSGKTHTMLGAQGRTLNGVLFCVILCYFVLLCCCVVVLCMYGR
jgi:hypothetical protein